jgi:hypothetical protein
MTAPTDAIAGLSERLRNGPLYDADIDGETSLLDKAATAIDALQARVKEYQLAEQELRNLLCSFVEQYCEPVPQWRPLDDLRGMISQFDNASTVVREFKARALRAKQERDEAYERADKSQRTLWFVLDANDGFTLEPADMESYPGDDRAEIVTTRNNCDGSISLKAAIRCLSAGPEKEKME